MPILRCPAPRFSTDRFRHERSQRRTFLHAALRAAWRSALLASLWLASGTFAQTPDEGAIAVAGPTTVVADPTTHSADSTAQATKPTRDYNRFYFQTSVFTYHFDPDPKHDNHNHVINAEYRFDKEWHGGRWIAGAASFTNSFGQPSQYVYGGWLYPIPQHESFYLKLSAGVIHGYEPPYQDKIPYNNNGYAPGAIPAAGYCYRQVCSEIIVFGWAGVMLTVGVAIH
jgi:hypothetical protein